MAQISGTVLTVLPPVEGQTATGTWVRSGFVIVPTDRPASRIAFEAMGEDMAGIISRLGVGMTVMVNYRVESREFAEKWFTSARVTSIQTLKIYS